MLRTAAIEPSRLMPGMPRIIAVTMLSIGSP